MSLKENSQEAEFIKFDGFLSADVMKEILSNSPGVLEVTGRCFESRRNRR